MVGTGSSELAANLLPNPVDEGRVCLYALNTGLSVYRRIIAQQALEVVIFNAQIGNQDAHGKNFSLLYGARSPVLAPFYDLLSIAVYLTLMPKMPMKIGSKYKFSGPEPKHREQFVQDAGLAKATTRKRLQVLAKSLPVESFASA